MTFEEIVMEAIEKDARATHALYESMRTSELLALQAAHQLDAAAATRPESIAFGGGRLALIAAVLSKRGIRPDHERLASISCPFCQRVSYNPNDIAQKYCGACHRFHDGRQPEASR